MPFAPSEELSHGVKVSAASVGIANLGVEEFFGSGNHELSD